MSKVFLPNTARDGVLLTAADRQLEPIFSHSSLQKKLYENLYTSLLFHDKVYLPDIFALISTAISDEATIQSKLI